MAASPAQAPVVDVGDNATPEASSDATAERWNRRSLRCSVAPCVRRRRSRLGIGVGDNDVGGKLRRYPCSSCRRYTCTSADATAEGWSRRESVFAVASHSGLRRECYALFYGGAQARIFTKER